MPISVLRLRSPLVARLVIYAANYNRWATDYPRALAELGPLYVHRYRGSARTGRAPYPDDRKVSSSDLLQTRCDKSTQTDFYQDGVLRDVLAMQVSKRLLGRDGFYRGFSDGEELLLVDSPSGSWRCTP